jgi:hypothetical protein
MKQRKFAGGGEMSDDMSPEDVAEMKRRRAAGRAYNQAMPEADTTYGSLSGSDKKSSPSMLNAVKNRIRTLGLTSEDDEVKGDSPMAAAARKKAIDKYDMATGTYSGPGTLISNAVRAVRGDLGTEAKARKEMGAKAAREADAEVKRETRGMKKGGMTASSRADGIAQRGKTRGKYL